MNLNSFQYFLEKEAIIRNPSLGIVRPVLIESQRKIVESFFDNHSVVVRKKRQDGVSTIFNLLMASLLLDDEEKNDIVFICSNYEKRSLKELITIIYEFQLNKNPSQRDAIASEDFIKIRSNYLKIVPSESFNIKSLIGLHPDFLFVSEANSINEKNIYNLFDFIKITRPKTIVSQENNSKTINELLEKFFKNENFKMLNGEYKDTFFRRKLILEKQKKDELAKRIFIDGRFLEFRQI